MTAFVWAKMQAEAGEPLEQIIVRKEAERTTGAGIFWWGYGSSLGDDLERAALAGGLTLPVLFSKMLSRPKKKDSDPDDVWLWNGWKTKSRQGQIPINVLVTGGTGPNRSHYALVCQSKGRLRLQDHGCFDPNQCWTYKSRNKKGQEKTPGASQVTSLLWDRKSSGHESGRYRLGFRATLVHPYAVTLTKPRLLNGSEQAMIKSYREGDDWMALVVKLRK